MAAAGPSEDADEDEDARLILLDSSMDDDAAAASLRSDAEAVVRSEEADAPDARLTRALVASRCLPPAFLDDADDDDVAAAVDALTHVHLDRARIASLLDEADDGVGPSRALPLRAAPSFALVASLHLQRNRLTTTRGIDDTRTPVLRFLTLEGNDLIDLDGLRTLRRLMFLDVSNNARLDASEAVLLAAPASTRFLKTAGCRNAARDDASTRAALVATLPSLRELDDVVVSARERREAKAAFGEEDSDDADDDDDEDAAAADDDDGGDVAAAADRLGRLAVGDDGRAAAAAAAAAVLAPSGSSATAASEDDDASVERLRALARTLADPSLSAVGARDAATAATTIDATRALRAAKDSASARGLTRADETRDGEIDVDARVRQGARRHGASLREANALRGRD